tara:strand:+ start:100 stop:324 length:225 start_codon:yes stop_codon:yes gene_type:complete
MDKTHQVILEMYMLRLKHYQVKGIGAQSELSTNTTITPELIKTTLERYIELGGDSDFSDITDEKYRAFLTEMKG